MVNRDWSEYNTRSRISNFSWTEDAIRDWADIWTSLWRLGFKWEWKNGDRYARRTGDRFTIFFVRGDAFRLEGGIPIPQIHVLDEIKELLLDDPTDNPDVPYAVKAINDWFSAHYTFKVSLDLNGED